MPSLSAFSQSHARCLFAAALLMFALGCRDTREDSNFCSACTSAEGAGETGEQTSPSETENTAPQSSGTGARPGTTTSPSSQAGTSNTSQGGTAAAPSGGTSAMSGSSPTAGARAPQGGAAARGGNGRDAGVGVGGMSSAERDAGSGDNGMSGMRDAGMMATDPEPKPDAGQMPAVPCNGMCPNDRPVCDESKAVPQCVQCTAEEQFACVGATATCDVAQQKCVQCTPQDSRNCDRATPTCNKDNRCVACTSDLPASCPAAQPLCDNEQRCVECLPGRMEFCPPERSMCNDGRCVTCMNDSQCVDPARPRCDTETNACVGCEGNSDCARFVDTTPICDEETKACVTCSPTGDELCPVGSYCDRGLYQCVPGTPKRRNCERCNSDDECADSASIAACIESQPDNARFCHVATFAATPVCEQGYTPANVPGRPNVMYCMPGSMTSCPAINNALANKTCSNPGDCGRGGQCPMPDNQCRVQCRSDQDCPATFICDQSANSCKR